MNAIDAMPEEVSGAVGKGTGKSGSRRMEVLRSVTIVSVATYIEYALGLVFSIWIARALGPTEFGRYAFTIWLCGWLIICSNHALTTSSTKFIAEAHGAGEPDVAAHISHRLIQYQHLSSFIVLALFVIATFIIRPTEWDHFLLPVTALVVIAVTAKAGYGMLAAVATGQERFEPEAIAAVLAGVLGLPLVIGAALLHQGVLTFIAIFALASLTLNLINRVLYRRYCQPYVAGPIPGAISKRLSRHLRLTGALVLLGSFKGSTIEVFLLNTFSTSAAVGFFAIAATLTRGAVQLFSVGLTSTLLPYMAKSFGQHGQEHAAGFLSEATRFYWAVGIAIAGLGLVTTPDIVTLMYGNRYVEAIPAIEATLVLAGLLLIGNGIAAFQTVVDRQDDRVRITVVALVANAILGIVLIPPFGLTGAVLTYAGTRFTDLGLAIYYLRRATSGGLPLALMSRLLAVGAVATLLAWLLTTSLASRWGFLAGAGLFVVIYLPGSILVRYWSDDDFRLMGMIGNRLGPPGRLLIRGLNRLQPTRTSLSMSSPQDACMPCTVLDSAAAIAGLHRELAQLAEQPGAASGIVQHPDWLRFELESRGAVAAPYVVVVRNASDRIVGYAPFLDERHHARIALGYRHVSLYRGRVLRLLGSGAVALPQERAMVEAAVARMLALDRAVKVIHIQETGLPNTLAEALSQTRWRFASVASHLLEQVNWTIRAQESLPAYLAGLGSKRRSSLGKKARSVFNKLGKEAHVRVFENPEDVGDYCRLMNELYARSWHAKERAIDWELPARRALFVELARRRQLVGHVLMLGPRPIAYEHGYRLGGRHLLDGTGYDEEFAAMGVGSVLVFQAIQYLVEQYPHDIIDFGFGDNEYKRLLATDQAPCGSLYLVRGVAARIRFAMIAPLRLAYRGMRRVRTRLHASRVGNVR